VSLLAPFDFNTEMAKNCRLSVLFHPTDFDDWYNGEHVEWVQVNNRNISVKCHPHKDGCNQTAQRPLLPCVNDISLDMLMPESGDLKIAAKIPQNVDECPYKGKMLSAVPVVTCLVGKKNAANNQLASKPVNLMASGSGSNKTCVTKMPLQCAKKGCASEIAIPVSSTCAGLGQCMLSIDVHPTDFDNKDGTSELIEYIKVDGTQVASAVNPGLNPCKSEWSGSPLQLSQMNFSALSNHAVNVTSGKVLVEAKISQFVDECASNGNLFDAVATVTCGKQGGTTSLLQTQNKAEPQHRQLRGRRL